MYLCNCATKGSAASELHGHANGCVCDCSRTDFDIDAASLQLNYMRENFAGNVSR